MTYELIVTPEAEFDLLEAAQWYENQRSGLGEEYVDAVKEKIEFLALNPLKYQIRFETIRFATVDRFPYAIHFEIVDQHKIYVLAITHTRRNPSKNI